MQFVPPEPRELKRELAEVLRQGGVAAAFAIRGPYWCAVLWSDFGFKELLKPQGMRWSQFEESYSDFSYVTIDWLQGHITWEEAYLTLLDEARRRLAA